MKCMQPVSVCVSYICYRWAREICTWPSCLSFGCASRLEHTILCAVITGLWHMPPNCIRCLKSEKYFLCKYILSFLFIFMWLMKSILKFSLTWLFWFTDDTCKSFIGRLNGVPACANRKLLTDILRKEWGFTGYVISDQQALENIVTRHKWVDNNVDAAAAVVNAGCNLELYGYSHTKHPVFASISKCRPLQASSVLKSFII